MINAQTINAKCGNTKTTILTGKDALGALTPEQKDELIQQKKQALKDGLVNFGHKVENVAYKGVGYVNEGYKLPFSITQKAVAGTALVGILALDIVKHTPEVTAAAGKFWIKGMAEARKNK